MIFPVKVLKARARRAKLAGKVTAGLSTLQGSHRDTEVAKGA